jgi:hypothetical protein
MHVVVHHIYSPWLYIVLASCRKRCWWPNIRSICSWRTEAYIQQSHITPQKNTSLGFASKYYDAHASSVVELSTVATHDAFAVSSSQHPACCCLLAPQGQNHRCTLKKGPCGWPRHPPTLPAGQGPICRRKLTRPLRPGPTKVFVGVVGQTSPQPPGPTKPPHAAAPSHRTDGRILCAGFFLIYDFTNLLINHPSQAERFLKFLFLRK